MAIINGTVENDYLTGTLEDDVIFGDLGNDTLDGSSTDTFIFKNIIRDLVLINVDDIYIYSDDGFDTILDGNLGQPKIVNIVNGEAQKYHASIKSGVAPAVTSAGSGITNYIYGSVNSDNINGTFADDIINSFSGNDRLYGGKGNDSLYGGVGDDSLHGDEEYDQIYGGSGNDYLSGGDSGDTLYGGTGDDTLNSRDGIADLLIGGTGDDLYIVNGDILLNSNTVATDVDNIQENLNEGTDTVESTGSYQLGENLENLILIGSSDIDGLGNELDNRIEGNSGKNFLVTGDGNDYLIGYENDDIVVGEAGRDTLLGGTGDDLLNGGSESDTLTGGAGSDTLTGGTDADTFVFSSPLDGVDNITDFNWEEGDKIQISAIGFGIGQDDYNSFIFNTTSNELLFEQVEIRENGSLSSLSPLITLQPGSNFNPSLDINII